MDSYLCTTKACTQSVGPLTSNFISVIYYINLRDVWSILSITMITRITQSNSNAGDKHGLH